MITDYTANRDYLKARMELIEVLLKNGSEIVVESSGEGFECEKVVFHEGKCRIVLKPEAPGT